MSIELKIGRNTYTTTDQDRFMDSGCTVQLLTQSKERLLGMYRLYPVLSKRAIKQISAFELVPESVYKARGEKSYQLFDTNLLRAIDWIRRRYGKPMTINNWMWEGGYEWSGLRTPDSPYYSPFSQHTFGRAVDFRLDGMSAQEVRNDLVLNWYSEGEEYSITLEDGVSWVHIDVRNDYDHVNIFKP